MTRVFRRYGVGARWYDVLSGERVVYGVGRRVGIGMLDLSPGDVVIDLGCGTGLNFPLLARAVGPEGLIVGVDRSGDMLAQARRRAQWLPCEVVLVEADAAELDVHALAGVIAEQTGRDRADALVTTYALSVMRGGAEEAWTRAAGLVCSGGGLLVVDMQPPVGVWRIFSPLARLACAFGGADIRLRPWRFVRPVAERDSVRGVAMRGGHVVAVAARRA
ncbi:methyltransferase domain-containing protein [Microbacterium sp. NPDC077184]|uniref:class I SAM-dependent methyltransferase n=1 Tax=Microbacterium sp. NPDC077184 TaxID=3154764 RepID=UPI003449285F